jgi:hypothetical protein
MKETWGCGTASARVCRLDLCRRGGPPGLTQSHNIPKITWVGPICIGPMPRPMRVRPSPGGNAGFRAPDPRAPVEPSPCPAQRFSVADGLLSEDGVAGARAPRIPVRNRGDSLPGCVCRGSGGAYFCAVERNTRAPCSAVGFADNAAVLAAAIRPAAVLNPPSRRRALSPCGHGHSSATHRVDYRISPHVGDIHRVKVTTHTSLMNDHNFLI